MVNPKKIVPVRNLIFFFFWTFLNSFINAESITHVDPADDAASLEYETYSQVKYEENKSQSDESFSRTSLQFFFPLFQFGTKEVFGGIRSELFLRDFRDTVEKINAHNLNRHTLALGSEVVKKNNQESFFMMTAGYNGDLQVDVSKALSGELIYAHFYTGFVRCKMGLGFDMLWYGDEWMPYPLLFLEWWIWQDTKLRLNADRGEIRQFIGQKLCLTFGTRYNLYFGALDKLGSGTNVQSLVSESYVLETGIEYPIWSHTFARLKFAKIYWGEDRFTAENQQVSTNTFSDGYSLKLSMAYAL